MIAAILFATALQGAAPPPSTQAEPTRSPVPPPAVCAPGFRIDTATKTCVADAAPVVSGQPAPPTGSAANDDTSQRVSEIHKEKKAKVNPFANK